MRLTPLHTTKHPSSPKAHLLHLEGRVAEPVILCTTREGQPSARMLVEIADPARPGLTLHRRVGSPMRREVVAAGSLAWAVALLRPGQQVRLTGWEHQAQRRAWGRLRRLRQIRLREIRTSEVQ